MRQVRCVGKCVTHVTPQRETDNKRHLAAVFDHDVRHQQEQYPIDIDRTEQIARSWITALLVRRERRWEKTREQLSGAIGKENATKRRQEKGDKHCGHKCAGLFSSKKDSKPFHVGLQTCFARQPDHGSTQRYVRRSLRTTKLKDIQDAVGRLELATTGSKVGISASNASISSGGAVRSMLQLHDQEHQN